MLKFFCKFARLNNIQNYNASESDVRLTAGLSI